MSAAANVGITDEEAALLNPAFVAALLHRAVSGYQRETDAGMPYVLLFLVAPTVLVKTTRDVLPERRDKPLAAWIQENPEVRLQFAETATACVPVVRRGLLFGVSKGVLKLIGDRVEAKPLKWGAAAAMARNTGDFQGVMNHANFVGRWYAHAGSLQTIMTLWGVRP